MKRIEEFAELIQQKSVEQVIFDLDSTLYTSQIGIETQVMESIRKTTARLLGIDISEALMLLKKYRLAYEMSFVGLERHHQLDRVTFLNEVFRDIDISRIPTYVGLPEVMKKAAASADVYLATNSNHEHAHRVLRHLGIMDTIMPERIFSCDDMGFVRKPNPKAVELMAKKFKLSDFSRVLFIDDSYASIKVFDNIGAHTILVADDFSSERVRQKVQNEEIPEGTAVTYDIVSCLNRLFI